MKLTDYAVTNRAVVWVLIVFIAAMGIISYFVLPREGPPDVPIPFVLITTAYEGVTPEDMESSVTLKIEKELTGLKGLKELSSSSAEGISTVIVEFQPNVSVEDALQYVRDRVELAKGELPIDAEEPIIREINIAEFPIMHINLSGPGSAVRLKQAADDLEDLIEAMPGVLGVDVVGTLEREIRIEINPDRLVNYNLTIPEVLAIIPAENVNISAGGLETPGTKFNVRVPAEFTTPEEVEYLLLTVRDGEPIYLSDVAKVSDTFKDRVSYSRLDGVDTITLQVKKRAGANIIALSDSVKRALDEAAAHLPPDTVVDTTFDMSKYIRSMVADLENNILSGLVLVVGVLMVFMTIRSSVIVSLAIPFSMLLSFIVIWAIGFTLNMIVLVSLVLALGMLVDNAIVIVENIYRHRQLGYRAIEAAKLGAREVAWPVTTSTLTTVVAFAPLLFWPGMMGEFMKYLPATVSITLLCSLFVALVINPMFCAIGLGKPHPKRERRHWFMAHYRKLLDLALRHSHITNALAAAVLILMIAIFTRFSKGVELFPKTDPDRAYVSIRAPQGTNIRETDRIARIVEERAQKYRKGPNGEVWIDHINANVGIGGGDIMGTRGGAEGPHMASIMLVFPDYEVRKKASAEIADELRADLAGISGAEIKLDVEKEGPPTGAPVAIRVIGRDFKELEKLSEEVRQTIITTPGLVNLRSDLEAARPELAFRVDRRRAMLNGVNTAIIGNFLKMSVFGTKVGTYRQYNDEYDITIRLPVEQRMNIEDLLRLRVPNNAGQPVPLSSLGEFEYTGGFGTIYRVNRNRVVTLTGDTEKDVLSQTVLADIETRLKPIRDKLVPPYGITYAGEQEEQQKAQAFLMKAFLVALFLVALVIVAQFSSLLHTLGIMSTVLLSTIGVLLALTMHQLPFSIIMSGIGIISLAGVVVNNAIVLLDYTLILQSRGLGLSQAAAEAAETRLRPVFLTAITTVLGLVPMATGISFDFHTFSWATRSSSAQWWRNMSLCVIWGLSFATVLTLIVVPSTYVLLVRAFGALRRFIARDLGWFRDLWSPADLRDSEESAPTLPAEDEASK